MKLPARVLFVGAHCDDIELFAGGLLARSCFGGSERVGVLVFSDHRGVVSDERAARARAEMRENLAWLATETGRPILDHSDAMLPACHGAFERERARIYGAIEALRDDYDLVVTHPPSDTNQDHAQVAEEVARVCKAHASVLAGEFPSNDLGDFRPEVFVALDERALAAKVRMIGRYESQRFGGRPYFDADAVTGLARTRGAQIRARAAEAFQILARAIVR
jgi:LmbE family N-acetylglucosaminyl deacetylase